MTSRAQGYGNKKTHVFHNSKRGDACRQYEIKPENRVKFASLTDALEAGFKQCKRCRWEK